MLAGLNSQFAASCAFDAVETDLAGNFGFPRQDTPPTGSFQSTTLVRFIEALGH